MNIEDTYGLGSARTVTPPTAESLALEAFNVRTSNRMEDLHEKLGERMKAHGLGTTSRYLRVYAEALSILRSKVAASERNLKIF